MPRIFDNILTVIPIILYYVFYCFFFVVVKCTRLEVSVYAAFTKRGFVSAARVWIRLV